jgi:hypothetical protein
MTTHYPIPLVVLSTFGQFVTNYGYYSVSHFKDIWHEFVNCTTCILKTNNSIGEVLLLYMACKNLGIIFSAIFLFFSSRWLLNLSLRSNQWCSSACFPCFSFSFACWILKEIKSSVSKKNPQWVERKEAPWKDVGIVQGSYANSQGIYSSP